MEKFIKSCEEMLAQIEMGELESIIEALNPLPPDIGPLPEKEAVEEYIAQLQEVPTEILASACTHLGYES